MRRLLPLAARVCELLRSCTYAPTQPRTEAPAVDLQRAKHRYALCAALSERMPCEQTESMRLNALREVLRARCGR
jgi:hypothetical protein